MQSSVVDEPSRKRRAHGYETPRPEVQALVPTTAQRILELGCSTGALGAAIKARNRAFVFGVEIDPEYARQAEQRLDRVVVADAEVFLRGHRPDQAPFDCLIGADIFEHLVDPWSALERAVDLLEPGAAVVISLPNVLYWPGLLRVVREGRWPRDDEGIFDRTHVRWFRWQRSDRYPRAVGRPVSLDIWWQFGLRRHACPIDARRQHVVLDVSRQAWAWAIKLPGRGASILSQPAADD
jgi:SAM-dependent methyltransferase